MRITLFGATGNVGSRIVVEALDRGHEVTAILRDTKKEYTLPAAVKIFAGDVRNQEDIIKFSRDQDVVVSATRPVEGKEYELVETTNILLEATAQTGTRLFISGGAGSLVVADKTILVVDEPHYLSPEYRDIALACVDQYEACKRVTTLGWTYLSPPALIEPGKRTGKYRVGKDELLIDSKGISRISLEDLAVAIIDEIENKQHLGLRFTVAY